MHCNRFPIRTLCLGETRLSSGYGIVQIEQQSSETRVTVIIYPPIMMSVILLLRSLYMYILTMIFVYVYIYGGFF